MIVDVQFLVGEQLRSAASAERWQMGFVLLGLAVEAELRRDACTGYVIHGGTGHFFHLLRIELVGVIVVVVVAFRGLCKVTRLIGIAAMVQRVLVLSVLLRVVRVLFIAGGVLEERRGGRLPGWGLRRKRG